MKSFLKLFLGSREGTVAIVTAVALPALIGTVALVAEFGHGLLTKAENQRVADLAAYAGALAYNATGLTADMDTAVASVAELNGVPAESATASLIDSPRDNGSQAVSVVIATENVLLLAPIVGADSSLPISASAAAEISGGTPGCIIALNPGQSGVTLSGGTEITATECGVSSNSSVTVPCGTEITAKSVTYDSSTAPSQPCGGIDADKLAKMAVDDPLAGHAGVAAGRARLDTVAGQTGPSAPTVSGGADIEFAWNQNRTKNAATAIGCSASWSQPVWTLTCPANGTYNIGNITTGGGITVNFNIASSATYNIVSITNTGTAMTFGPGTYNIAQGLRTGGGTDTAFGAGTFNIGPTSSNCGGAKHSICHEGTTLTFGGPSTFVLSSGVYNKGGSTMTLGAGDTNSFDIGPSSIGHAVSVGGGSKTIFADALGADSLFRLTGNLHAPNGGGSCLRVSAAAQHDINGYVSAAGGVIFGSGIYTIDGYMAFGASNGGNVTCEGQSVGVRAIDTTFFVSGASTACSGGRAFCVGAGYSTVTITAPDSGDMANLAVVGPANNTAGALFTAGASNTVVSGAFYFPNGPVDLSGGAGLGSGAGQCLQLVGSRVSLSGGTAIASACISNEGSSGGVVLVQ